MKNVADLIEVTQVAQSRISEVDFNHLIFGAVYTDHMFVMDYKDGVWQTPKIIPYQAFSYEPSAKVFHYGQAIFEGMKAYKFIETGDVYLFRPEKNIRRMNLSAERLAMPQIPEDIFLSALKKLVDLDSSWVPEGFGKALYIRPVFIATENQISAAPSTDYRFMIILSPADKYYSGDVKVKIETRYSRACNGGIGYAKAAGNYAAQFMPTNKALEEGYQQIIWTDSCNHKYLEEAGTMNMFFRLGDNLVTAPTGDRILNGVTRDSIITIAKDHGINVEVRPIEVKEVVEGAKSGHLKEIFGTGTAATVLPIVGLGYEGEYYALPRLDNAYANVLKEMLMNIQYGIAPDPYGWMVPVKN